MMKQTTGVVTALLASALFLSGCAGTGTGSGTDVFSGASNASAESAATAAPTPEPIDGDENGDGKLSEREKELIAKRSYILLDGTVVPTPKQGEPIPEAIIENIRAKASDSIEGMKGSTINVAAEEGFIDTIREEQARISRKIIPVFHATDGACGCLVWAVSGDADGKIKPSSTMQAALDAANAWAAGKDRYVVIVFD